MQAPVAQRQTHIPLPEQSHLKEKHDLQKKAENTFKKFKEDKNIQGKDVEDLSLNQLKEKLETLTKDFLSPKSAKVKDVSADIFKPAVPVEQKAFENNINYYQIHSKKLQERFLEIASYTEEVLKKLDQVKNTAIDAALKAHSADRQLTLFREKLPAELWQFTAKEWKNQAAIVGKIFDGLEEKLNTYKIQEKISESDAEGIQGKDKLFNERCEGLEKLSTEVKQRIQEFDALITAQAIVPDENHPLASLFKATNADPMCMEARQKAEEVVYKNLSELREFRDGKVKEWNEMAIHAYETYLKIEWSMLTQAILPSLKNLYIDIQMKFDFINKERTLNRETLPKKLEKSSQDNLIEFINSCFVKYNNIKSLIEQTFTRADSIQKEIAYRNGAVLESLCITQEAPKLQEVIQAKEEKKGSEKKETDPATKPNILLDFRESNCKEECEKAIDAKTLKIKQSYDTLKNALKDLSNDIVTRYAELNKEIGLRAYALENGSWPTKVLTSGPAKEIFSPVLGTSFMDIVSSLFRSVKASPQNNLSFMRFKLEDVRVSEAEKKEEEKKA